MHAYLFEPSAEQLALSDTPAADVAALNRSAAALVSCGIRLMYGSTTIRPHWNAEHVVVVHAFVSPFGEAMACCGGGDEGGEDGEGEGGEELHLAWCGLEVRCRV